MNNLVKLLVFDVDGTLTIGQSEVENEIAQTICWFEKCGIKICLASGKDLYYLSALSRGMGIKSPYFIAENGGVWFFEGKRYVSINKDVKDSLNQIKSMISKKFSRIWFQPNEVCLTIMSKENFLISEIEDYLYKNMSLEMFTVYPHYFQECSSVDILPKDIDKVVGLRYIMKKLELTHKEVIVAGDSVSDSQMAQCTDLMLIVGSGLPDIKNAKYFRCPYEMINFLYNNIIR